MSIICKICKTDGDLMGDDESLFECTTNNSHIWSYHLDCKKGGDNKQSLFIGWLPYDVLDEEENDSYKSVMKNKRFLDTYDSDKWEDCSSFVWKCKCCNKYYMNMMCG